MANDTKEWDRIVRAVAQMAGNVKVGVIASKGGNAPASSGDISLVELAAIHEFGAPAAGIPERSFIRSTMTEKKSELVAVQTKLVGKIIAGSLTVDQALNVLGTWAAAEVKKSITSKDIPPPLKPKTIAAKGSSKPLVDTGKLLNAISYEVSKGED